MNDTNHHIFMLVKAMPIANSKYWWRFDTYEIEEDHAYNMSPADRRTVRKITF